MTLQNAINEIESRFPLRKVVMIEYEDGSGKKFNYRLNGDSKNRFINLTNNEFVERYYQAEKIMSKWK